MRGHVYPMAGDTAEKAERSAECEPGGFMEDTEKIMEEKSEQHGKSSRIVFRIS